VYFRAMPNGAPLVDRWSVRVSAMPKDRQAAVRPRFGSRGALELHEIGGELAEAHWKDSSEWRAPLARVRGRLVSRGAPVPGARVRLIGTDYEYTTRADGSFEMTRVVPGRYTFAIPHADLNGIGMEFTRVQSVAVARGDTAVVDVQLPTVRDFIASKCPQWHGDSVHNVLVGRVYTSRGQAALAANLVLEQRVKVQLDSVWERAYEGRAGAGTLFFSAYDGESGSGGIFYICALRPAKEYKLTVELDGETATVHISTLVRDRGIFVADIRLRAR
jgi:hypothetical protein